MPTHQTGSSAPDWPLIEPASSESSSSDQAEHDHDLGWVELGEESGPDPEQGKWQQFGTELPDAVLALLAAPVSPSEPVSPAAARPDLTPRFLAPGVDDSQVS